MKSINKLIGEVVAISMLFIGCGDKEKKDSKAPMEVTQLSQGASSSNGFATVAGGQGVQYLKFGWQQPESTHTWTSGKNSILTFPINEQIAKKGATLTLDVNWVLNNRQSVVFSIGGQQIAKLDIVSSGKYVVDIPAGTLSVKSTDIDISLPDAKSPKELLQGDDTRVLAIAIKNIAIQPK